VGGYFGNVKVAKVEHIEVSSFAHLLTMYSLTARTLCVLG
jgi:hypothetical protein